jgi:hypothetical protein
VDSVCKRVEEDDEYRDSNFFKTVFIHLENNIMPNTYPKEPISCMKQHIFHSFFEFGVLLGFNFSCCLFLRDPKFTLILTK